MMINQRKYISIILANFIDHFDTALYAFLTPILVNIFLPDSQDHITKLILGYGIFAISFITRPLGACIFGTLVKRIGTKKTLIYSILGVSISTSIMGLVPDYKYIGIAAPITILILRISQSIFASGESAITTLYIISEQKDELRAKKCNYWYETSTICGIIFASLISSIIIKLNIDHIWRLAFLFSIITCLICYFLRKDDLLEEIPCKYEDQKLIKEKSEINNNYLGILAITLKKLFIYRKHILKIFFVNGFCQLTYYVPFVLMNNTIPIITDITLENMMYVNNIILILDAILIAIIGRVLLKFQAIKLMLFSSISLLITIIPIWYFLENASLFYVSLVRFWIIICGVIYLSQLNIWLNKLIDHDDKYMIIGFSRSLSTILYGKTLPFIALVLLDKTNSHFVISIYLAILIFCTIYTLFASNSAIEYK